MNRRNALVSSRRQKDGASIGNEGDEVTKEVGKMRGSESYRGERGRVSRSVHLSIRLFFLSSTFHHSSPLSTGINNGLPVLPWQLSKR